MKHHFTPLYFSTGGPGLVDPCEKKPVDTLTSMGEQQREDITSSAQVYTLELYINNQAH